ncbi:3'5' exonuclease [Pandoravirus kuranda]|uniref:3'5' exonuclease n=1 Tax=Pandoravirus kuranda TaxID=3019033 RepID=A0AA95EGL4_9VIRU|nr:3'5' exonuclease [Pandoravirus kuranda]
MASIMTEHRNTSTYPLDACVSGETAFAPSDQVKALNDVVERALMRWSAGMTLRALDPHVRWATGRSLSQWASALNQRTRADLLRTLPAVGAADNIAGHTVIYPARTSKRVRDDSRSRCRSDAATHDLCEPALLKALAARPVPVIVVDTVDACREAVERIRRCGEAAFDCEGTSVVRPGTASPGIALIQIALRDGPSYLFDMCRPEPSRSARSLMHYGGLGALLADRSVTKVVHDAREDARALAAAHGCHLAGVFDTQVVHMRLAGCNMLRPGLNAVLAEHGLATNQHKDAMRAIYPIDIYYWHRRPLPEKWMPDYAVSDVDLLLRLKDALVARLLAAAPAPPWAAGLLPVPPPPVRSARCWAVVVTGSLHAKARDPAPRSSTTPAPMDAAAGAGLRGAGVKERSGSLARPSVVKTDSGAASTPTRHRRGSRNMPDAMAARSAATTTGAVVVSH